MKSILLLFCFFFLVGYYSELKGQKEYPPQIESSKEVTFKVIDDVELKLWIFNPPSHKPTDNRPAIVFFFGGGWNGGSPTQFVKHCEYLSARGMIAMVADYRVKSRNGVKAKTCVSDAKSAIRWVRENAKMLGVDPDRIVAGGGSAGGHLAAATATLKDFDDPGENLSVSSKPNALVLFNPVLVLAAGENENEVQNKKMENIEQRLGANPKSMSPYHNVEKGIAPTIVFHGTEDPTVPFVTVEMFTNKMQEVGNKCKLVAYQGEKHGFFNYGKKSNGPFIDTVNEMDKFLTSLGYLQAPPDKTIISY